MALGERERNRARERLAAFAASGPPAAEAQTTAIAILRRAVGFERWCWPRTDPASGVANGGTAEFDLWSEVPRMAALEEHGDVTRKPSLVAGPRASVSLSAATGGDLSRSTRWRECLRPHGVGDELMTVCRDPHGCWGSVELMRDSGDPPFDEADVQFLDDLAPTLGKLLRRSLPGPRASDRELPRPATLILDAEHQPVGWTPALVAWLDELHGLPPALYEIAARVLTPAAARTGLSPSVRVVTTSGRWATIEGTPFDGGDRGVVAITVRAASSDEVFDVLCRVYALTTRERELVGLVLSGLATKQLASELHLSPHTIQDHLKAVFAKTGVRTRRELATHLTGWRSPLAGASR